MIDNRGGKKPPAVSIYNLSCVERNRAFATEGGSKNEGGGQKATRPPDYLF